MKSPTVTRGSIASIQALVSSQAASNVLVDIEIYDPAGNKVFQRWFENQSFQRGQTREFPVAWNVPNHTERTSYMVKIGVFTPGWSAVRSWQDQAAQFTVR
jgi:hypothetical protein